MLSRRDAAQILHSQNRQLSSTRTHYRRLPTALVRSFQRTVRGRDGHTSTATSMARLPPLFEPSHFQSVTALALAHKAREARK